MDKEKYGNMGGGGQKNKGPTTMGKPGVIGAINSYKRVSQANPIEEISHLSQLAWYLTETVTNRPETRALYVHRIEYVHINIWQLAGCAFARFAESCGKIIVRDGKEHLPL